MQRARELRGWTQQQLADNSGLTVTTVCATETGRSKPRFATAEAIAESLGRAVRDFWPLLADAIEQGRLLGTVIPLEQAARVRRRHSHSHGLKLVYEAPVGGRIVRHRHRPPICCGANWCRCVDVDDPATYPIFGDPKLIEFAEGGVNG